MIVELTLMLIMVGAAFAYVALTGKPRKKPDVKNQTTKRCPYLDCDWWITFKDLNDEVRRMYRKHYSEVHKEVPQMNFETVENYPLQDSMLQRALSRN
jgi:hypothetical protein